LERAGSTFLSPGNAIRQVEENRGEEGGARSLRGAHYVLEKRRGRKITTGIAKVREAAEGGHETHRPLRAERRGRAPVESHEAWLHERKGKGARGEVFDAAHERGKEV